MIFKFIIITCLISISPKTYAQETVSGKLAISILKSLPLNEGTMAFQGEVKCTVSFIPDTITNSIETNCIVLTQNSKGKLIKKEISKDQDLYSLLNVKIDLEENSHSKHAFINCNGIFKTNVFGNEKIAKATCEIDDLY